MPVMSAWELLDVVRADSDPCRVPMIVLSGMRAPAGGPCLVKPVTADELLVTVERVRRH
jgi:CheY-like chemotaxis protein